MTTTSLLLLTATLATPGASFRVDGLGIVTDASHPRRPGDVFHAEVALRLAVRPDRGEAAIEVNSGSGAEQVVDRYHVRQGRILQRDDAGREVPAASLGDLSPATVAAIHPALVELAMRERPETVARREGGDLLFAWNGELWRVLVDPETARVIGLSRRLFHDVLGDLEEEVRYAYEASIGGDACRGTIVTLGGREILRLALEAPAAHDVPALPGPGVATDGTPVVPVPPVVSEDEVVLRELAPLVHAVDLPSLNVRVVVVEMKDHLVVLEGAFSSRVCDVLARVLRERLGKPVRAFAFSHLHGQYVGGVRSFIHEGATVLVPPGTVPLVQSIAAADHELRPDALAAEHRPLHLRTVTGSLRLEDETNTLDVYDVPSGHTDEYLLFHLPRQKVLLTGDLLFYRPGKPLTGRSRQLCDTVARLGLEVETYVATWPLDGYGTRSTVTAAEMAAACE